MTPCKSKTCAAGRQHSFPRADHFGVGLPPSKGQQHGWCVPRPAAPASVPVERSNPRGNTSQSKFKSLDKNSRISAIWLFRLQTLFLIRSTHAHISVQSKNIKNTTHRLDHHHCFSKHASLHWFIFGFARDFCPGVLGAPSRALMAAWYHGDHLSMPRV